MSASGDAPGIAAGHRLPRLRELVARLLGTSWSFFRASEAASDIVVAHHGSVEIHQTQAGWSAETFVKGEPDRARDTALQRFGKYVNGNKRNGMRLHIVWPLLQTEDAPRRWRVRIGLPNLESALVATGARNGKVRIRALEPETLAVICLSGRPTPLAIMRGGIAIRHAIANTRWEATGGPMLRLRTTPSALPFFGRFEVAVPVADRLSGSTLSHPLAASSSIDRWARSPPRSSSRQPADAAAWGINGSADDPSKHA